MLRKRWNKKGQFFLIVAIITIMTIFTVTAKYNTVRQMVVLEDFKELSEQYTTEKPKVINAAIFAGQEESSVIIPFTEQFVSYAQQREPSFGVLSVYRDQLGNLHIVNLLNNKILNIDYKQGEKETMLSLFCQSGPTCQTGGQICNQVPGGGNFCTSVETAVGNYGGDFSNVKTLDGVTELRIIIPGPTPNDPPADAIVLDRSKLESFINQNLLQAEVPLEDSTFVRVSVSGS